MFTVFLYTGKGFNNFRSNIPDNLVVFAEGSYQEARKLFVNKIGKEPELMGFQSAEGESKEGAWNSAIESKLVSPDVNLDMVMALDDTLVIEKPEEKQPEQTVSP